MKFSSQNSPKLGLNLISAFYLFLFLTILVLAYTGQLPTHRILVIPYADKIGHVVLYCIAAYMGHRVLRHRHIPFLGLAVPLFPLLFGLFTLVEEGAQGLAPNRTLDGIDLVASLIGVWLGYWLAEQHKVEDNA
ncbi:MAG: hypothetical protein QNJ46_00615 [Leptolyngbyaceae cyanobacterium MO_188.B28]|nr:hypothetical protein [Leptolyngbyaceae cyanobacterium MO_188.B28]